MASRSDNIYLDYNPDAEFYVDTDILTRSDCDFIQLTFKDNECLKEGERDEILNYYNQGYNSDGSIKNAYFANLWQVYGLGNIGNLQGVIYNNWAIIDEIPNDADFISYGLDFGFANSKTAFMVMFKKENNLYLKELIYKTGLTGSDTIKEFEKLNIDKRLSIVADHARPEMIEDIRRAGYSIRECIKGSGSVITGIDVLQRYNIFITKDSPNAINEARSYRWALDKNGKSSNRSSASTRTHDKIRRKQGASRAPFA
jgi:phage terminase large subunit